MGTILYRGEPGIGFTAAGGRTTHGQRRVERRCTFETTTGRLNDAF
jgi:hypothetical protein